MKKILTTAFIFAITGILSIYAQNRIYTPSPVAPLNNAIAQTPDVIIDWTAVTGGNTGIITYELHFDSDPAFPNALVYMTEFVSGYQMTELMFGQTYYWKVRAKDGDDVSGWSDTWSFTVMRRMETTKPLEAAVKQKPTLNLEWLPVTGIIHYEYQFDTIGFWKTIESPVASNLTAVSVVDDTHAWLVGAGGKILFFDGASLTEQTSPVTTDLQGVCFLDINNGWAVGKGGTILYYNGTDWAEQENTNTNDLNSVFFLDGSNGWAVGKTGVILHYDGTAWTANSFSASNDLYSVAFADANNGIAVGKTGAGAIYNGTSWDAMTTNTARDLYCCAMKDASTGYAAGKSGLFKKMKDGVWEPGNPAMGTKDYTGMFISGMNGWTVGKSGSVLQFDGYEWFTSSVGSAVNMLGVSVNGDAGFLVGETGYAAMLDDQAFTSPMAQVIHMVPGNVALTSVSNLLFGTTYYWRMRAIHSLDVSEWSGARSFTTMFTVDMDKPDDNATDQNLDVQLKWIKVVDNIDYQIQIDEDMNFGSPIPLETTALNINAEMLTFGTVYYWRVRAVHSLDASDWPVARKFTTIGSVILTAPANNATDVKQSPLLTWQPITGIAGYQVQLSQDDSFAEPIVDQMIDAISSSLAVPVILEKNTQYFWRVRAYKTLDSSNWSSTWAFTTIPPVGIGENGDIPGLSVFPNPATNLLYVQMDNRQETPVLMLVSDLLGKPVMEMELSNGGSSKTYTLDVSTLTKGIYMMQLKSGSKVMTRKLIISR